MPPEITTDSLRALLNDVLDERSRIDQQTHRDHHAWVQARIDRERVRTEFWTALAAKSLPGIAWTLIAAVFGLALKFIRDHVSWN